MISPPKTLARHPVATCQRCLARPPGRVEATGCRLGAFLLFCRRPRKGNALGTIGSLKRMLLSAAAAALFVSSAARAASTQGPVVAHTPVTSAVPGGFVKVLAKVTDEVKVFPQVFFRYDPAGQYEKALDMKPVKGEPHVYGANIPVKGAVVEYYVEAYDEQGNGPGRAGSPESPLHVTVGNEVPRASAQPAPAPAPPPAPSAQAPWNPSAPAPASSALRTPASRADAGRAPARIWTWAVGGAGVGLLTGGLVAGLAAKTASNAYDARVKDAQNNPVTLQSQYDAAKGISTKATILTIAGVVLIAGGVALYFLEPGLNASELYAGASDGASDLSVAAAPVEGGGAVAVAGRF